MLRFQNVFARVRRRLADERGIALVTALGVLFVLSMTLTALVSYTSANSRTSARERAAQQAQSLAEAGINNALAVVFNAENPEDGSILPDGSPERPALVNTYEGGSVRWWGQMVNTATGVWRWEITSVGSVKNPTGPGAADVRRTLTANVNLRLPDEAPLQIPMWNWIYSAKTGSECDTTIDQSVKLASPLYVVGNLCLRNTASIVRGPLVVEGAVRLLEPQNAIGSSTSRISEIYVGNGCRRQTNAVYNPCNFANNAFNHTQTNIWVDKEYDFANEGPMRIPPILWDDAYRLASPGPRSPCSIISGRPPVFDAPDPHDGVLRRNNNVQGVFELTPPTSYTCSTRRGELSWNATDRVLTVRGLVYIDGSASITNGLVNSYDAFSAFYLSGTLAIKNSSVCAALTTGKSGCDQNGWDPNTRMLVFAADGRGGQITTPDTSIEIVSSHFQGALYGTYAVKATTTSQTQGPAVAQEVVIGQSNNVTFPKISVVPIGMPGNPIPAPSLEEPEIG